MSSSTTVAAVVVGGPFVLTVAAIVIVPAMLARRSAAAAASSAISWASLLHVVPISVTSVLDYLSDVLVAAVMVNGEGEQLVLGRIALGFLGLSIVCAWVTLVGFWVTETRAAYGHDQRLKLHQLLLASLLAPFNLHVLYLGIVYSSEDYSHTVGVAEGGGDGAPQTPGTPKTPGSPSTRALRSTNAGWYCMLANPNPNPNPNPKPNPNPNPKQVLHVRHAQAARDVARERAPRHPHRGCHRDGGQRGEHAAVRALPC